MNIYAVPMLISAILCAMLSVVTWLFRRRERINRVFSLFTLALAADAFAFFVWFQFGSVENIDTWMRITFTAGFVVPTALIFFFFAFTGFDKKLDAKVLGIKVRHFRNTILLFILACTLLAQFTNLILDISASPKHIWDIQFGPLGLFMFPLYAIIFVYLFTMAFKSYSYLGTAVMAVFYFVAIVNYQSDKLYELNLNLERKVEDRTYELKQKNSELEDILTKLKEMQKQVIFQEKMATLGQLVAGLTHEINTP